MDSKDQEDGENKRKLLAFANGTSSEISKEENLKDCLAGKTRLLNLFSPSENSLNL